jgi:hypothetical protein
VGLNGLALAVMGWHDMAWDGMVQDGINNKLG